MAVYLVVAAALLWSLTAILLTGPILVRQTAKLDLPYELDVSPERLRRDVELLSGDLAPRQHQPQENLDRTAEVGGRLQGIKGQYLIFDGGVINLRKYSGYRVELLA